MALVPDWLSREDASRALFLLLGALLGAFKDAFVWVGRLITQWVRDHRNSRKAVTIVQDWMRPEAQNFWHLVTSSGRVSMHFVGHFIVTNRTDKGLSFTRVECNPAGGASVFHVRALGFGEQGATAFEVSPQSLGDVRIEFGLDPAPDWTGDRKLELSLTDSAGVERKVKATFLPLPDANPAKASAASKSDKA
jgi:hypothetical protein